MGKTVSSRVGGGGGLVSTCHILAPSGLFALPPAMLPGPLPRWGGHARLPSPRLGSLRWGPAGLKEPRDVLGQCCAHHEPLPPVLPYPLFLVPAADPRAPPPPRRQEPATLPSLGPHCPTSAPGPGGHPAVQASISSAPSGALLALMRKAAVALGMEGPELACPTGV